MKRLGIAQTNPGTEKVMGDVYLGIAIAGVDILVIMGGAIAFFWM